MKNLRGPIRSAEYASSTRVALFSASRIVPSPFDPVLVDPSPAILSADERNFRELIDKASTLGGPES